MAAIVAKTDVEMYDAIRECIFQLVTGAQEYSISTGSTSRTYRKANLEELQKAEEMYRVRIERAELRLQRGKGISVIRGVYYN
jgi:hypothetical protein